jgi:hypothetical protein
MTSAIVRLLIMKAGKNNAYYNARGHILAKQSHYNSTLENMHAFKTIEILEKKTKMFGNNTREVASC